MTKRRDTPTSDAETQTPSVFNESWYPHQALRPFVARITGYLEYELEVPNQEQTPIVGIVPMIFVLNAGWDYQVNEVREVLGTSFVAGVRSSPVTMISNGFAVCLQVDFTPRGARRFLGIDMHELSDRICPLDSVLGSYSRLLEEKLAGTNSWTERFALLERVLLERLLLQEPKKNTNSSAVEAALVAIAAQPSLPTVSMLAKDVGVSRKHLVDLFTREIGVTPSRYLQLKQFEEALAMMHSNKAKRLIDIAYDCGFSDQAHFSRQFRRFMNKSPMEYLAKYPELPER